jgi:hypothetical protein
MSVHVPCWVWPPRYDIKGWRIHPGQVSYGPRNNYDAAVVSIVGPRSEERYACCCRFFPTR